MIIIQLNSPFLASFQFRAMFLFCLLFLCCCLTHPSYGINNIRDEQPIITCIEQEKKALLNFKLSLNNDYCSNMLSSWGDQGGIRDCCRWEGVRCSNRTSHVIMLDLHGHVSSEYNKNYYCLEGDWSALASLAELKHLEYLDLSSNNFKGDLIPNLLCNLSNLKYLNLSSNGFNLFGLLPNQLVDLSQLTTLDLSGIDLSGSTNWFRCITNLPSLRVLRLNWCNLPPVVHDESLSYVNKSTNFRVISLSENGLNDSSILGWLFNLSAVHTHLAFVDLSNNELTGTIPDAIGNLESLAYLDLSNNFISGPIPTTFKHMKALSHLRLSNNRLKGPIPSAIAGMCSLSHLYLDQNHLVGSIPYALGNLKSLAYIDLSSNSFSGPIPMTLENLHNLSYLDFSHNKLNGPIPSAFDYMHSLSHLGLSDNQLIGPIPNAIGNLKSLAFLDLSHNSLSGSIPDTVRNLKALELLSLSKNSISGTIPDFLAYMLHLKTLFLSHNLLSGVIPSQLGQSQHLDYYDLSYNKLWGSIPAALQEGPADAFEGGDNNLCGAPLPIMCPLVGKEEPRKSDIYYLGLYVSIGLGFILGFWGVCGTLYLKNAWRYALFQFLDDTTNKIYVLVTIYIVKLKRNNAQL